MKNTDTPALDVLACVDRMDAGAFAEYFAEGAALRVANGPPAVGKKAIRDHVEALFERLSGISHAVQDQWVVGGTTIIQLEVTYFRPDGTSIAIPGVTIFHREKAGITDYRIYSDMTPVFA